MTDAVPNPSKRSHGPIEEHLLSVEQVCEQYGVRVDGERPLQSVGLSTAEAGERLRTHGPNVMTPPKRTPAWRRFVFHSLLNLFNILLIVAGVLCFVTLAIAPQDKMPLYVGAVLLVVALLNATIEFIQEQRSQALLSGFMDLLPRKCNVVRDGSLASMPACDLVPGDVVAIRMGDKVPADIRLFYVQEFKVDNSSLTGESDPQERSVTNEHKNPLEATNLAFNGSLVVNGECYGIVVRTGDATVLGQIANLTGSEKKRPSPMTQEIDNYVRIITVAAIITAIVFFIIGVVNGLESEDAKADPNYGRVWAANIAFAIGVFVSFVPEGLPVTMTMLLSIAAKRMAKRNVLIKELRGVETLGAITCLATDKTGTLTRNQMTVTYIWSGLGLWDASATSGTQQEATKVQFDQAGQMAMQNIQPQQQQDMYKKFDMANKCLNDLTHIAYLCSKAKFDRVDVPIKDRSIIGDATESGLFRFASSAITDSDALNETYPKVFEIPFNSTNKWHLSIHRRQHASGPLTLYIKGAPERVFRLCSFMMNQNGETVGMTEGHQASFQRAYEHLAAKGHRVIGCAKLELGSEYGESYQFKRDEKEWEKTKAADPSVKGGVYPKTGYTFVGLVSLEDPPKHGVREAVGQCRQAGVKVMMVTGDHPLTAEAIGRKINLMLQETKEMVAKRTGRPVASIQEHEYNAIVIHGEMIDKFTEEDWDRVLDKEEIIFARTSPKHKLQIVKRCQARGHIVGVTGDGVNDSPALKKADLGIAMNISGSDVSKEAAAMILLDDNFASTVAGITEGRLIFQNLKKSIRYTITHTMPQVIANLLFLIVPMPLPLGALQIIMVDLGFELCNGFSYAYEVPESKKRGLMTMLPRKPVTPKTIALIQEDNERDLARRRFIDKKVNGPDSTYVHKEDVNEDEEKPKDLFGRVKYSLASIQFTLSQLTQRAYWKRLTTKEGETLVDSNILSYAYLEMGILETIGCLVTFFFVFYHEVGLTPYWVVQNQSLLMNPSDSEKLKTATGELDLNAQQQRELLGKAQAAYYMALFFQQAFNLFICKVTLRLPFGTMLLRNRATWLGLLLGFAIACFVVYAPFMHEPFGTFTLNPIYWLVPIASGLVMLAYGSVRVWYLRRRRPVNNNMALPLDLHPTRWSTKSARD